LRKIGKGGYALVLRHRVQNLKRHPKARDEDNMRVLSATHGAEPIDQFVELFFGVVAHFKSTIGM
jgi:hypothetical protein